MFSFTRNSKLIFQSAYTGFVFTNNMHKFLLLDILATLRFVRILKYCHYFMGLLGLNWYLLVLICSYIINNKIVMCWWTICVFSSLMCSSLLQIFHFWLICGGYLNSLHMTSLLDVYVCILQTSFLRLWLIFKSFFNCFTKVLNLLWSNYQSLFFKWYFGLLIKKSFPV